MTSNSCFKAQGQEVQLQIGTDDVDKKKHKKQKRTSNALSGFEEVFEEFAKSTMKNSANMINDFPADNKVDVTQVRLQRWVIL